MSFNNSINQPIGFDNQKVKVDLHQPEDKGEKNLEKKTENNEIIKDIKNENMMIETLTQIKKEPEKKNIETPPKKQEITKTDQPAMTMKPKLIENIDKNKKPINLVSEFKKAPVSNPVKKQIEPIKIKKEVSSPTKKTLVPEIKKQEIKQPIIHSAEKLIEKPKKYEKITEVKSYEQEKTKEPSKNIRSPYFLNKLLIFIFF